MPGKALQTALCVMLAVKPILLAADDDTNEEARLKYKSAFAEKLKLPKRVEILESVVKDYADTPAAEEAEDLLTDCGALGVEITDANRAQIVERLEDVLRERE